MGGVIASCLISFAWVAGVVYLNTIRGMGISLLCYAGPLPCWLMFFVIGVLVGRYPERQYPIVLPITITLIGISLSVIESNYLIAHFGNGDGIKPSTYIYSAGMILLLFSRKTENLLTNAGILYRCLIWIGSLSFGIYLIHCHIIGFVVKKMAIDSWSLKWGLTLLLTILFILVSKNILPLKFHKYFGI